MVGIEGLGVVVGGGKVGGRGHKVIEGVVSKRCVCVCVCVFCQV